MANQQRPPARKYQAVSIEDEIENLENYEPGGFHPVNLFDVLDDRFEVIYKLGFGGIAMVWLCYEFDAERWRAVKINAASHSSDDCAELKVLEVMKENNITPEELEARHIIVPWETFWIDGPNGRHLCSVMPVLGPNLSKWRPELAREFDTIDKMCYQFTEGLGLLHSLGIAHGDFRPANVLTRFKPQVLDKISVDEMKHLLDAPDMEEVLTLKGEKSDHAPEEVVTGIRWNRLRKLISDDIAIVDFGESYCVGDPPPSMGIPRQYGAPEVVFGATPIIQSDIWSLAYTLMEFRLGASLMSSLPAIVWSMERFAGPLPHEYRSTGVEMIEEETGEPLKLPTDGRSTSEVQIWRPITENEDELNEMSESLAEGTDYTCPLEIKLGAEHWTSMSPPTEKDGIWWPSESGFYRLPSDEVILFADLLRGMFKYSPEERLSASEALAHPWFTRKHVDNDRKVRRGPGTLVPTKRTGGCLFSSFLLAIFLTIFVVLWILTSEKLSHGDWIGVSLIIAVGLI